MASSVGSDEKSTKVKLLELKDVAYTYGAKGIVIKEPVSPGEVFEPGNNAAIESLEIAFQNEQYEERRKAIQAAAQRLREEDFTAREDFLQQQEGYEQDYERWVKETENIENTPYDAVIFPCRRCDILGDRLYIISNSKLYCGGVEARVRFAREGDIRHARKMSRKSTLINTSVTFYDSLYAGPLPQEIADKYEGAKEFFPTEDIVVFSTVKEYFNMKENVFASLSRWDPIMLGFRHGQKFFICAWDWEHEDTNILTA